MLQTPARTLLGLPVASHSDFVIKIQQGIV